MKLQMQMWPHTETHIEFRGRLRDFILSRKAWASDVAAI